MCTIGSITIATEAGLLKTLGIQDLEAYTGLPRRTIHFYVKEGLIPPPEGAGRGAHYEWHHVHALKLVSALKAATHLRLEGIREILRDMPPEIMHRWVERIENGKRTAGELAAKYAVKTAPGQGDASSTHSLLAAPDRSGKARGDEPETEFDRLLDEGGGEAELHRLLDEAGGASMAQRASIKEPGPVEDAPPPDDEDLSPDMRTMSSPPDAHTIAEPASKRSMSLFGRFMRKRAAGDERPEAGWNPESWERVHLADGLEIQIRADASDERRKQIETIIQFAKEMLDE